MPDYLADLQKRQEDDQGFRCPVGRFLASDADEVVREGIRKALDPSTGIYATTIASVITEHGIPVGEKAVRNHRKSNCSCSRRGI